MKFRPNPLLYGADEDFSSAFLLDVTMRFPVDPEALARAVSEAMARYPYFSVRPVRHGNSLMLESNPLPVPVFPDNRTVTLGTGQSNGHLLAFGCSGRSVFLNASHYIADGMGILPLLKTVLYLYVSAEHGAEGLDKNGIRLPGEPVPEGEYAYPFPDMPFECDGRMLPRKAPESVYAPDPAAFEPGGLYAYHLRVSQRDMMAKAKTSDGSPISFLSVMMYRALCSLDPEQMLPVVSHVQHQYRAAIGKTLSHHSLVSYIPVVFPARMREWSVEQQNTGVRGQIILSSEPSSELSSVNRLLNAWPQDKDAAFEERRRAMSRFAKDSIRNKTFGISYVGKMDWSGLDGYVEDLHAYIGEKQTRGMLLIEVMAIGDDFSLTFMQSGRGERYLRAFIDQLNRCGIPVRVAGQKRYALCDTRIPD